MYRIVCLIALLCSAIAQAQPPPTAQLQQEARDLVGEFAGRLKPQLQSALHEGGPAHAIGICADRAPEIADALSAQSGWQVKRVSLKSRNASRATPDPWERDVLLRFDARQAAGEQPQQLNHGEIVGGHYRYMQAQGVEPVCLMCHGESLSEPVLQTLRDYYPDDTATGYLPGQVRGAISLSRPLGD